MDSRGAGSGVTQAQRIRRRNRVITSCLECRRRKLKCDKVHPRCGQCQRQYRECKYLDPAIDPDARRVVNEYKDRRDNVEHRLEEGTSGPVRRRSRQDSRDDNASDLDDVASLPDDEKGLEPTPLASENTAYDDDADVLIDQGFALGKIRVTERVGGFVRPRLVIDMLGSVKSTTNFPDQLLLPQRAKPIDFNNLPEWLQLPRDYIAPDDNSMLSVAGSSSMNPFDLLQSRDLCQTLLQQYWNACHPIVTCVHKPSFERRYSLFWQSLQEGSEPPPSLQAVVYAAMFTAAVSLTETGSAGWGSLKFDLMYEFKTRCEIALGQARFKSTTKRETLQAFIMYLIPFCRREVSRSVRALVSAAIVIAQCASFHEDPSFFGFDAVETHVRRLLWHQLCILDIRTVEAVGPLPQIHLSDMGNRTTRFPLLVDDSDLSHSFPPKEDNQQWTETMFTQIRFEVATMQLQLWYDRRAIRSKKVSLSSVLNKIQQFQEAIETKFLTHIDSSQPLQAFTDCAARLHLSRLYLFVLADYIVPGSKDLPNRLRRVVVHHATRTLELGIQLEENPACKPWQWYTGAIHQYHASTLMLMEVTIHPDNPEADRIWRCMDYLFCGPDGVKASPADSRRDKSVKIMIEWGRRLDAYHGLRHQRAPIPSDERLGRAGKVFRDLEKQGISLRAETEQDHAEQARVAKQSAQQPQVPTPSVSPPAMQPSASSQFMYSTGYAQQQQQQQQQQSMPPQSSIFSSQGPTNQSEPGSTPTSDTSHSLPNPAIFADRDLARVEWVDLSELGDWSNIVPTEMDYTMGSDMIPDQSQLMSEQALVDSVKDVDLGEGLGPQTFYAAPPGGWLR